MEGIAIWDAVRDSQYNTAKMLYRCCCVCVCASPSFLLHVREHKMARQQSDHLYLDQKTLPAHFTIQASGRVMPMMARNDNVDGKWYFTSMAWLWPNAVSLAYLVRLSCFCGVFSLHLLRLCCR